MDVCCHLSKSDQHDGMVLRQNVFFPENGLKFGGQANTQVQLVHDELW